MYGVGRKTGSRLRALPHVRTLSDPSAQSGAARSLAVGACIAGGGPAGMMLGLLLARRGVRTVVLEKHADFLRDFRGDTIHPSTLAIVAQLGLLDEFLALPHQRADRLSGRIEDAAVTIADFTRLGPPFAYLAFMPQWEFLAFLARHATRYPQFDLRMQARAGELLWDGDRVAGVRAQTPDGPLEVRATLTVGADGRSSDLRARAGLTVRELGAPMDVLWMRLPKRDDDPHDTFGYVRDGRILALIDRGDYWQCAYVIAKGSQTQLRERGIAGLRDDLAATVPFLADRVAELRDWDDVRLLNVALNRLQHWYRPGLLCIGDAAHAMSPIGGVGINLAIQDAVAAANALSEPLLAGTLRAADLRAVQRRREFPAKVTQALQAIVQRRFIGQVLAGRRPPRWTAAIPWILARFPGLAGVTARLVGYGVRPERIEG